MYSRIVPREIAAPYFWSRGRSSNYIERRYRRLNAFLDHTRAWTLRMLKSRNCTYIPGPFYWTYIPIKSGHERNPFDRASRGENRRFRFRMLTNPKPDTYDTYDTYDKAPKGLNCDYYAFRLWGDLRCEEYHYPLVGWLPGLSKLHQVEIENICSSSSSSSRCE